MPLRFQRRNAISGRSMFSGAGLRLVSLTMGLALVVILMQIARSPGTVEKLGILFGGAPPAPPTVGGKVAVPLPDVDASLLETIEDNTHFRDEEIQAWFHLLGIASSATADQLAAASLGEIAYAQLLNQPEFYRGQVVHVDGNARRVESIMPAANDADVDQLYLILVQPSRDLLRPFAIYCHELPAGWSIDDNLPNDGRMTCEALFFKNKVYDNQLGVDLMPVFLAHSVTPIARSDTLVDRTPALPAWQMIAVAALVVGGIVLWISVRNTDHPRPRVALDATEVAKTLESLDRDQDGRA